MTILEQIEKLDKFIKQLEEELSEMKAHHSVLVAMNETRADALAIKLIKTINVFSREKKEYQLKKENLENTLKTLNGIFYFMEAK